jgi:hypothetical protein
VLGAQHRDFTDGDAVPRHRPVVVVDDLDLDRADRPAGRAKAVAPGGVRQRRAMVLGVEHAHDDRGLGLAVQLEQVAAEGADEALDGRGRERRAAVADRTQARQVDTKSILRVHQIHHHRRDPEEASHPLPLDRPQDELGVEARHRRHDDLAAEHQGRDHIQLRVVEHLRQHHRHVVAPQPLVAEQTDDAGLDHRVGHRHALRQPLGPAGRDAGEEVIAPWGDGVARGPRGASFGARQRRPVIDAVEQLDARHGCGQRARLSGELGGVQERARAELRRRSGQRHLGQAPVQRQHDEPAPGEGDQSQRVIDRVAAQQGDAVARLQGGVTEQCREPVGLELQVGVGEATLGEDEGLAVGVQRRAAADHL